MSVRKMVVGTIAVLSTLAVAGCGTATSLSSGSADAALTKSTFAAAMTNATSRYHSVHVNGNIAVQGQQVTMAVDESASGSALKNVAMQATVSMGGLYQVQIRVVDGNLYVNKAGMPILPGSTKPWVKIPLDDPANPFGGVLSKINGSMSPAALATMFRSISTLTELGPATIDTIATTHYRVTVDVSKAASMLGLPPGSDTAALPKTIAYDVWLDSLSRPVMVSMHTSEGSLGLQFSQWGESVHVVAPPASQVSTFSR